MTEFKSVKAISNLFEFDAEGKTLEGKFLGVREETSNKGKELLVGSVSLPDETTRDFFVGGMLKGLLEKVEVGKQIQIVFEGKKEAQIKDDNGEMVSAMCNQFDVLVAN